MAARDWMRATGLAALLAGLGGCAHADGPPAVSDQAILVAHAVNAVQELRSQPNLQRFVTGKLAHARAVMIVPDMYKAGFLVGGAYGTGLLLIRNPRGGWNGPAFYSITSASFGLQAGIQDASEMLVIMSQGGLRAVMDNRFKLGASAGVAVATVGANAAADTTANGGADIYMVATAVGAYGGLTLDGSVILPKQSWNDAYYGNHLSAGQILTQGRAGNPQANALKDALGS
jgi:lipid-binding SYLF domain-containing protein